MSVLEHLLENWPAFKFHRLVKVKQDNWFNSLHSRLDDTAMLLQFDFSENAEVVEQDEVQGAHWWHLQVCQHFLIYIILTSCQLLSG